MFLDEYGTVLLEYGAKFTYVPIGAIGKEKVEIL